MGIAQPRLLSEAERNAISERLVAMTPTERLSEIRQLSARRPDDLARILVELAGSVDADTIRLASYASSPGAAALLAKGIEKAQVNGPAKAEGDAPLLPLVERPGAAGGEIDMRRIRPFRQYVLPDGDRVAHDGEALVPAATVQATAPKTLQGGAVLWPGSESGPRPIDWSGIIERIPRVSVRGAVGAAGAAALTVLKPWNAEDEYRYFGEGARLRTAPGNMYGTVQEFDADAGEWVETGLVGFAVSAGAGAPASVVTGTPEQIDRVRADSLTALDGQLPPPPGLVPPVVPDTGREEFPATESHPDVHETPPEASEGDTETFPIPETPRAQAEIYLALSDEIIRELRKPLEAHRGDEYTQRGNDIVVQKLYEQLARWFPDINVEMKFTHEAGATLHGEGKEKVKERIVRDEKSRSYSVPDIKIKDTVNDGLIALTTGEFLKDESNLIADERRQLARLKKNLGNSGVAAGLPKLRPGMDETQYTERVEKQLEEFFTRYFGRPPTG